jgi:hypothetical protein
MPSLLVKSSFAEVKKENGDGTASVKNYEPTWSFKTGDKHETIVEADISDVGTDGQLRVLAILMHDCTLSLLM